MDQPYIGARSGALTPTTLSRVMTLLAVAAAFTAAGAAVGPMLGRAGTLVGVLGGLVCVIVLGFVKERRPFNMILLCAFATFEGIFLGGIIDVYVRSGLGLIVLDAAAVTAGVTLIAGLYGYTTKRDLSRLGSFLFIGLLAVIGASLLGFFIHLPLLYTAISAATAVLFTGFLIFDLNRIARAGEVSTGDAILLAVSVYLDVLNIFLSILRLLSDSRR